jgi:hypothetical protein
LFWITKPKPKLIVTKLPEYLLSPVFLPNLVNEYPRFLPNLLLDSNLKIIGGKVAALSIAVSALIRYKIESLIPSKPNKST